MSADQQNADRADETSSREQPAGEGAGDASPLEQVIDDSEGREESEEWAYKEMVRGRTAEEVAADLAASGWSEEDAAGMAETARRRTRHLRGVTTREEVARGAEARYRQGMALGRMLLLGLFFGAAVQFRRVLAGFVGSLRRRKPHRTGVPQADRNPPPTNGSAPAE